MNTTFRIVVLLSAALLLSGCVAARYKAASKNSPTAVALNLASRPAEAGGAHDTEKDAPTPRDITAVVNAVIVYRGPGSWKREAYWDEYVLTLSTQGEKPILVDSAVLTDFRGDLVTDVGEPWSLEEQSHRFAKDFSRNGGDALAIGAAGALTTSAALMAPIVGGWGLIGGVVAGVASLPVYAGVTLYRNFSSKKEIEEEFRRRRLVLPAVLAPNRDVSGSLFFRITPGPKTLTLQCRVEREPRTLVIDLAPLGRLHLKAEAAAPVPAGGGK